ncbi:MAG: putative ABC exporter domain-containing protein [Clostridiaceae bacterium]|nr:putative ABC exporter domain-containing protein [Clostridiaceae bacterium]
MNGVLTYLLVTRFKNNVRRFFRKPSRLILTLVCIALIGFTIFAGNADAPENPVYRDIRELCAIAFVFYSFVFLMTAYNGFSKGATLFTMPDVNLVFTAPLRRQSVLFYGLIQQLGSSLLVGIFLLFQYTMLHVNYGIKYLDLIWLLVGYSLSVFCGQLTAMVLYTKTALSERRRRLARTVFYTILSAAAVIVFVRLYGSRDSLLESAVALATGPLAFFPVSGWLSYAVQGIFARQAMPIFIGVAAAVVYIALLVLWIVRSDDDYYEDVYGITEKNFKTREAAKSGQQPATMTGKVRRGRGTLSHGAGASAIYYKHLLENRRANPLLLEPSAFIFIIVSVAFTFLMRTDGGIVAGFAFAVYMRIFGAMLGRLQRELVKPYIYLIPEPPFKKLFFALAEAFPKFALNALLMYAPIALICRQSPAETILCALAGFSFDVLFLAGYVLVERLFSSMTSKALSMFVFFLTMIILAAPGGVLAFLLYTFGLILISASFTVFLTLFFVNVVLSLIVIFACRNMLAYAELNLQ